MSDLYTTLSLSPKKKRTLPDSDDDDTTTVTPKRMRTALPTPTSTGNRKHRKVVNAVVVELPDHLQRLRNTHTALLMALSHALATCAVSPTSDTGLVLAVVNHLSIASYSGLSTRFDSDELRRLCWLWEWDTKSLPPALIPLTKTSVIVADEQENPFISTPKPIRQKPLEKPLADEDENPFLDTPKATRSNKAGGNVSPSKSKGKSKVIDDDENPFLDDDPKPSPSSKDWVRGGMGVVVSATTHYAKGASRRVPAYGIGIEVEIDIDKGMSSGMAAVARWTSANESRKQQFHKKLERWVELHPDAAPIPDIPLADLPELSVPTQPSSLTRLLASASPKAPASIAILQTPTSPSRSPTKSLTKHTSPVKIPGIPFPVVPGSTVSSPVKGATPAKNLLLFPKTPSNRQSRAELAATLFGSRTPSSSPTRSQASSPTRSDSSSSIPSTPVHQRGSDAETAPATPSSSRRQALYERIRQKSLVTSPTKSSRLGRELSPTKIDKDQLLRMSQEETRRRLLLGRLGGIAESIWMFFSSPAGSTSMTPTMRKRRMMPNTEVTHAIIKSSPVPISLADAQESINLLTSLCPFFLKAVDIAGEEWLEMPATVRSGTDEKDMPETPTKSKTIAPAIAASPGRVPPSPGRSRGKNDSAQEILTRSPRRVKQEAGGLREVRERIRRELELNE